MAALVRRTLREGVVTLVLERPELLNALGPALSTELLEVFRASAADDRTRAIVLTGAGRAFSAGGDIGWFGELLPGGPAHVQQEIAHFMEEIGNPLTQAIAQCPVPVVSAVNGPCAASR